MGGVFHGGRLDAAIAEFGGCREDWLDLSTGINPNPYPLGSVSAAAWQRLPDEGVEGELLQAAREYYRVPASMEIVAANGTQALIELLPQIVTKAEIAILSPTYGEHAYAWGKYGHDVVACRDINGLTTGIGLVVNPNNPDCRVHSRVELLEAAERTDLLVVDEAFCDSTPEASIVSDMPGNMIVLKSFGKFFGLAGLRLGFAICCFELAERLRSRIGPWAVSGPALEIGTQALRSTEWAVETRHTLRQMSQELARVLEAAGLKVEGVNPLFVYASHADAAGIYEGLAKVHILVRPFPDRPGFLRFGLPKSKAELRRLNLALKGPGDG